MRSLAPAAPATVPAAPAAAAPAAAPAAAAPAAAVAPNDDSVPLGGGRGAQVLRELIDEQRDVAQLASRRRGQRARGHAVGGVLDVARGRAVHGRQLRGLVRSQHLALHTR